VNIFAGFPGLFSSGIQSVANLLFAISEKILPTQTLFFSYTGIAFLILEMEFKFNSDS
jgi:hypothetical protein